MLVSSNEIKYWFDSNFYTFCRVQKNVFLDNRTVPFSETTSEAICTYKIEGYLQCKHSLLQL